MYEIFETKENNEEIYRFYCNSDNFKVEDISNNLNKPVYIFLRDMDFFFQQLLKCFV